MVFGGQVGVTDNTTVGDGVVGGGAAVILSKVPAGRMVLGYPAVKLDTHVDMYKAQRRLPRMMEEFAEMKARLARALTEHVVPLLASGAVRPPVDSTFPLADVAKAHARMDSSAHVGKIVLLMKPEA
mgnify:CR=1 FL=1